MAKSQVLKLDSEEWHNAILELAIKQIAMTEAAALTLIEAVAKDDDHANELVEMFNEQYATSSRRHLQILIDTRGKIDIDDIVKRR